SYSGTKLTEAIKQVDIGLIAPGVGSTSGDSALDGSSGGGAGDDTGGEAGSGGGSGGGDEGGDDSGNPPGDGGDGGGSDSGGDETGGSTQQAPWTLVMPYDGRYSSGGNNLVVSDGSASGISGLSLGGSYWA